MITMMNGKLLRLVLEKKIEWWSGDEGSRLSAHQEDLLGVFESLSRLYLFWGMLRLRCRTFCTIPQDWKADRMSCVWKYAVEVLSFVFVRA